MYMKLTRNDFDSDNEWLKCCAARWVIYETKTRRVPYFSNGKSKAEWFKKKFNDELNDYIAEMKELIKNKTLHKSV